MVIPKHTFFIDTTFILRNTHSAFFGAPLFVKDGVDNTFLYGFLRDFLRIRKSIGINNGLLAFCKDSISVTSKENVLQVINFINELKIPNSYHENQNILEIYHQLTGDVSYIVSPDKKLLQLANDNVSIVIPSDPKNILCMSPSSIKRKLGVDPINIPTFLALTEGAVSLNLTKLQAIRLVELFGDLDNIYDNITKITPVIKKKLEKNKDSFLTKYTESKIQDDWRKSPAITKDWSINLNNDKTVSILEAYGFYSLTRLLKTPTKINLKITTDISESTSYKAVLDLKSLKKLEKLLLSSEFCSIDTESDDKDPRHATLFGVSFSVKKGEAYFLPLIEENLKDITSEDVLSFLNRIVNTPIKYIGHNIKYDYLLLRRNSVNIKNIYFDTLLAAYECFGDWTFFNLKHLSSKLLGKQIKSYNEIVEKHQTFLDLPLKQIVNHGCEDADVTLQLYYRLNEELKKKEIEDQYFSDTLPLIKQLGNLEFEGVPVKINNLESVRLDILSKSEKTKKAVYDEIGLEFDIDSQKELSVVLNKNLDLQQFVGSKKVTLGALKQLAITKSVLKLIVKYKTIQSQLKKVDSILKRVKNNKIYPLFNQTKLPYGAVSSISPDIFGISGIEKIQACFPSEIEPLFKCEKKSIDIISRIVQDPNLNMDWKKRRNQYMVANPIMKELNTNELFLAIISGYSDYKLSKEFMLDRTTVLTIRHDLYMRYQILFNWIEQFKKQTLDKGFAVYQNKKKYFAGLKSSNIETREIAVNNSIRWILKY
ncbi:DNA polymerase [uncultured Desulfobacter sp.]|uniref:DNA polymerase n=1 Tax=uncultured Desulfobacter sp. TaxID=240139 RepID=UPI002AA6C044|nr:DNA polymerase [uncultured Desulfobacter sp.]